MKKTIIERLIIIGTALFAYWLLGFELAVITLLSSLFYEVVKLKR